MPPVYRGKLPGSTALGTALSDYRLCIYEPGAGGSRGVNRLRYDLSQCLLDVSLTDSFEQPAQQLDVTLSAQLDLPTYEDSAASGVDVRSITELGRPVRLYGPRVTPDGNVYPLPDGFPEVISKTSGEFYPLNNLLFYGFIFNKSISASTAGDSVTLTCFDPLFYLARNMYDTPWVASKKTKVQGRNGRPKGWRADEIIQKICEDSQIRISNIENTQVRLRKVVTVGLSLYDTCLLALEKTYNQGKTKRRYTLRYDPRAGVELIGRRMPNNMTAREKQVWDLRDEDNLLSATYTASIENLVTAVTVKTDGEKGRKQIGGVYRDAKLEAKYGAMHQIVDIESPGSPAEAQKARRALMRDQGRVQETIDVSIPCINSLRAGDGVWVKDSDTGIQALLWISSVSHEVGASDALTNLTLVREPREIAYPQVSDPQNQPSRGSYVTMKDASGETLKIEVSYRVVDIISESNFGGRGAVFTGDESVATVRKDSRLDQLCKGKERQFLIGPSGKGKSGATAVIVGRHTEDVDVKISLSVGEGAQLGRVGKTGRAIAKPKRQKIKGS